MQSDSGEGEVNAPMKSIPILFEDADVVIIDKPSSMLVHEDGRSTGNTVVDWFLSYVPHARGVGEPGRGSDGSELLRSGVVHRLDAETSGVLVLAKHQDAFVHLKRQFHDRLVKKEYRAFVYGSMKERWGTIRRAIGRSPKDFRLRSAERGARGPLRKATTHWEVLAQSSTNAYLRVTPETGRTHQIRVHMRAIGKPIVCDRVYAGEKQSLDSLGFSRLALHAHALTLELPSGTKQRFESPLPPDFVAAAARVAMG
jgi:23S rRNA pseudouridine1911/1915/1917 synthase